MSLNAYENFHGLLIRFVKILLFNIDSSDLVLPFFKQIRLVLLQM